MISNTKIDRTEREDGVIVSTIRPTCMAWYGKYETAISFNDQETWNIAQGYNTEEEARAGHKKYAAMTKQELDKIEWL